MGNTNTKHFPEWMKVKENVLIFRKLSRYGFMGVPLTTQLHQGDWYISFVFQGKKWLWQIIS